MAVVLITAESVIRFNSRNPYNGLDSKRGDVLDYQT